MPAEKEIGTFDAKITSIRVQSINGEERVIEGTYEAEITGQMSGMATGTMTFTGSNERGTVKDLGVGYLAAGEAVSAEGAGLYWNTKPGHWEVRVGYSIGGQNVVGEGHIDLDARSLTGKMFELT